MGSPHRAVCSPTRLKSGCPVHFQRPEASGAGDSRAAEATSVTGAGEPQSSSVKRTPALLAQSTVFLRCLFLTFTLSSETPPQCWGVLVRLHSAQRPQIRPLWTQQRSSHPRPLLRELRPAWCTRHSQKYTGTVS